MTDPTGPQLKPQDTIILILGELRGQMGSVIASQSASQATQAAINAENKREHEEFRTAIAEIKATQPVKVSPWAKAGVVIAIPSSLVALVGFIVLYFQPH